MSNLENFNQQELFDKPDNTLLYNIFAEQTVLGAIILNNDLMYKILTILDVEHFHDKKHQEIYKAMCKLCNKNLSIHHVSLEQQLIGITDTKSIIEEKYLEQISITAATTFNVSEYAEIVYQLALKRSLIQFGKELVQEAATKGLSVSPEDQIEKAENFLFKLSRKSQDRGFISLKDALDKSIEHIDLCRNNPNITSGIPTKFQAIDRIISGFHGGDLVILAARPGMGKTTLALNFAYNSGLHFALEDDTHASIGIFSLEMQSEQLSNKILSMEANINSAKLLSGKLQEDEYNAIQSASNRLAQLPVFIDDMAAISIHSIRARARRLKKKNNLKLLIIDYLQLIRPSRNMQNRVLEMSEITQELKSLAKELNIPIIALSQLSRAVESRIDKRPLLSDLRESGSIEQDADIVMFIYREQYYSKIAPNNNSIQDNNNIAEVMIAKHRNGPIGNTQLLFFPHIAKFVDIKS